MFTGIITDVGHLLEVEQRGDLRARIDGLDVVVFPDGRLRLVGCDSAERALALHRRLREDA